MWWNDVLMRAGTALMLMVAVACQNGLVEENGGNAESDVLEVRLDVAGHCTEEVRSILPEETVETKVTDVTLAAYDSEGHLVNALYYDEVEAAMSLYLRESGVNTVYALANMGDMTASFPVTESEVDELVYMLDSYDTVVSRGIPMCGLLKNCSCGDDRVLTVSLERLFAKLRARILHTGLSESTISTVYAYNLCNKSLYLRQANRRLRPFAQAGSASEVPEDVLEVSDYNPDLADKDAYEGSLAQQYWGPGLGYFQDTTIVLYVPENRQGVLLPSNTDPFCKTADNIADIGGKAYDDLCTYLEFTATKPLRGDGYGGDITYRCYLGEDNHSNFSVRRNRCYDLTMNFTNGGFHLDSWKVVRGENWTDTRTLCFVDDPVVVYPGTTVNLLVHYNRFSAAADTESSGPLSDWVYEFDDEAMTNAGLTCTFMENEKVAGSNGCSDHYFKITASENAKVGESFSVKVSMADGTGSDIASVHVAEIGEIAPVWDYMPEYVSQTGKLKLAGVVEALLPMTVTVSDPSVMSCVAESDDSFVVTALGEGQTDLIFSNVDGSQTLTLSLDVSAPQLKVSDIYVALSPDGEAGYLDYYYADVQGKPITNVDEQAYAACLRPVLSGCGYISMNVVGNSMEMCVGRLSDSGNQIGLGTYYDISIAAVGCPGAGVHDMRAYIIDPFNGQPTFDLRSIDDYTLFAGSGVHSVLRNHFSDENDAWTDIRYTMPPVDADPMYVTSSLEPEWLDVFSSRNDVFFTEYSHSDSSSGASVTICRRSADADFLHSAGRHALKLNVVNRHTGEVISHMLGHVDIYVHTAIGARAEFGSLVCSHPSGGNASTVAGIYNNLAGYTFYTPSSSDLIHYMDVSMEYLTDVSNVYVFEQMQAGVSSYRNFMNCLDVVRPSVSDGTVDYNLNMLYSVCAGGGDRVGICGETYGLRKGIGTVLYRALYLFPFTSVQSDGDLKRLMLGYDEQQSVAIGTYAPCYKMHDMNIGSDMDANVVSKNYPYYFSPVSCSAYRDESGRGYHVIHTLNAVVPRTNGWINLL